MKKNMLLMECKRKAPKILLLFLGMYSVQTSEFVRVLGEVNRLPKTLKSIGELGGVIAAVSIMIGIFYLVYTREREDNFSTVFGFQNKKRCFLSELISMISTMVVFSYRLSISLVMTSYIYNDHGTLTLSALMVVLTMMVLRELVQIGISLFQEQNQSTLRQAVSGKKAV